MKRTIPAFLLIPIVCAASCARASALQVADGVPDRRTVTVGDGISVRSGLELTALRPGQRYRFVPPDSLATGLGSDDASSVAEPKLAVWREAFSAVMGRARWVESTDSAQFDVTIFTTARITMQREPRVRLAVNATRCGDRPSTQLQLCTDDPVDYTEAWSTQYHTFQIIRRRSDGALRVWRLPGDATAPARARVAAELLEMLRSGEDG